MDEYHPGYRLHAPGAAGSAKSYHAPGRDFPPVDDHLDEPEVTRWERIGGRRLEALPANRDHAVAQVRLDKVIDAFVAPGYEAASDLKTRFDEESDFASDTAVLKAGIDPETKTRYLEELAFEIVSEQGAGVPTEKAKRMVRRGVKRVFAVFLKKGRVAEWSSSEGRWTTLHPSSSIADERLVRPIPVKALLDAAAADEAVAQALVAKDNPVVGKLRQEGQVEALARSILGVLEARGIEVDESFRQRVLSTTDVDVLTRWVRRAAVAESAAEVPEA